LPLHRHSGQQLLPEGWKLGQSRVKQFLESIEAEEEDDSQILLFEMEATPVQKAAAETVKKRQKALSMAVNRTRPSFIRPTGVARNAPAPHVSKRERCPKGRGRLRFEDHR